MTDLVSFFGNKLGNILHKLSREMYINFQILVIDLGEKVVSALLYSIFSL